MKDQIQEIVDFVNRNYSVHYKPEDIRKAILGHIQNNTFVVLKDDKGIAAVCRWNVRANVANVLDLAIRKDIRRSGILKYVVMQGWKKFQYLKWITFERQMKYPEKEIKFYPIKRFIGRK